MLHKDMISASTKLVEQSTLVIHITPHTEFPQQHVCFNYCHSNLHYAQLTVKPLAFGSVSSIQRYDSLLEQHQVFIRILITNVDIKPSSHDR